MPQQLSEIEFPDRYLSIEQVATITNVSEKTLKRRWKKGEFPKPDKFGRLLKFKWSDIAAYFAGTWSAGKTR